MPRDWGIRWRNGTTRRKFDISHFFGKGGVGGWLGREFSLKNIVPLALTALGATVGTVVEPGFGTAIGAGLGNYAGREIEGEKPVQSIEGGLEAGALSYAGSELAGAGQAGGALAGTEVGNALNTVGSDLGAIGGDVNSALGGIPGEIGSAVTDIGGDLGLSGGTGAALSGSTGGGTLIGNEVNNLASDVGLGGAGGSYVGNAINSLGSDVGIGASGASQALAAKTGTEIGANAASTVISTAPAGGGLLSGFGLKDALAAAPIAIDLLKGNQSQPGENQLKSEAGLLTQQGQQLASYLQNGTLPPGVQASINQATNAATSSIRSRYASMGMSGSSAEAQDIAAAQQQAATEGAQTALQLLSQGISEQNMGSQLYQDIMNYSLQEDQGLGQAIGNFAVALSGNSGAPNTNQPTTKAA